MADLDDPKKLVEGEAVEVLALEREVEQLHTALSQNEQFARFMELSRAVSAKKEEVRARIKAIMIPAYQAGQVDKRIEGDWGSVTVTESDQFTVDEKTLPAKFFKKVPDTTKIRATYQLEGKAPKGTEQFKQYGIMLKIKGTEG